MPSPWEKIEQTLNPIGLLAILALPVVAGIPLVGFLVETISIFFVILFAFRRNYLFLAVAGIGSLSSAILMHGSSLIIISLWARAFIPGFILGILISAGVSMSRAFIFSILAIALSVVIQYWEEREIIFQVLDKFQSWITGGLPAGTDEQTNAMIDYVAQTIAVIKRLMPALMVLSVVAQLFAGWILLVIFLKAIGEFFPGIIEFYYWKMPDFCLYIIGPAIAVRLIGGESLKVVADNIIMFIGFFYAAFGFALFEYYLKRIRLSLFLRILFYIGFIFLQLPGLVLAAAVGLFDSYFDFRNVKAKLIG